MNTKIKEIILRYRRQLIILVHFFIFVAAYILSVMLRFDFDVPASELPGLYKGFPLIIETQMLIFAALNQYKGFWLYVSVKDLIQLTRANIIASLIIFIAFLGLGWEFFPRSIFLLDFILSLGMTCAVRVFCKFLRETWHRRNFSSKDHNILIVGAGYAGVRLLKEIRRNPSMGTVIGFVDDDPKKAGEIIQDVRVLGNRKRIPVIVQNDQVDEIILSIPSAKGEVVRDILSYCEQTPAKIRICPSLDKVITGVSEVRPRNVLPDDLLGRKTVQINSDDIKGYIKDRVVLVTGAGGSIGSEICRQVAAFGPKELILLDHHENFVYFLTVEFKSKYPNLHVSTVIGDIRDVGLLKNLFMKKRPQVVFHAAAHKHVPLMEDSPVAAVKNNIFGSRNMIYASEHYNVERFVLISTDKAVNPINTMGMSKRVAEIILQSRAQKSYTKFMVVRFGNVLGSAGSVVPLFKKQIEEGGPITVTHPDVKRYFMSIKEAVLLVLQAGAIGKGGELFILDMGEQIKVVEIAKNLLALSGYRLDKDIKIKFTGLRPGEKLEEEILLDKEKDLVTKHNKIFMSPNGVVINRRDLHKTLKRLYRMAELMDEKGIRSLLKDIISMGNGVNLPLENIEENYVSASASLAESHRQ